MPVGSDPIYARHKRSGAVFLSVRSISDYRCYHQFSEKLSPVAHHAVRVRFLYSCCVEEAEAAERHASADHAADEQTRTSRWPKRTVPSIRNEEEVERCEPDRLRSPSACAEVCKSSTEEPRS